MNITKWWAIAAGVWSFNSILWALTGNWFLSIGSMFVAFLSLFNWSRED